MAHRSPTHAWLVLVLVSVVAAVPARAADDAASSNNPFRLFLATEQPAVFFLPDEADSAELVFQNDQAQPVRGLLRYGVRRRADDPVKLTAERTIEVGAETEVRFELPRQFIDDLGMYYLDWRFESGDEAWEGVSSFACMIPVGVTPEIRQEPFIFGIAGGIRPHWDYALKDRFLHAAALIGTKAYRIDVAWNHIQPDPQTWNWRHLDETVDLAERYGLFVQPLIAYGVDWAITPEARAYLDAQESDGSSRFWPSRYPMQLGPWGAYCRALAERYGTRMQYYEIWNEPDIGFFHGTAEDYVGMLKEAYRQIKTANPEIVVTTGGFTSLDHPALKHDLQLLTFTEGADSFDVVAWHRHSDFSRFQAEVDDDLLPLLKEKGLDSKGLVFNETAMASTFRGEWRLAPELVKKMTFSWARGAIGHYWYNLTRSHPDFYMLNKDWTPRPSYPAYNELARWLRGRTFSHELNLGEGRWGFVFRGKGHFTGEGDDDWVLVAWTQDASLADVPFALRVSPGARAYRVDLMGNRQPVTIDAAGVVAMNIQHEPQYLVIEGSSIRPQPSERLFRVDASPTLAPGESATLRVWMTNPLDQPLKMNLRAEVAEPLRLESIEMPESAVPAGQAAEATLMLSLGQLENGAAHRGEVALFLEPLGYEMRVPVEWGRRLASRTVAGRAPDFVIEDEGDIVNENHVDPQRMHLTWGGPSDLSARAWLTREGNDVRLRLEVRDDAHRQPHAGASLWKGDCVQIALAIPGRDGQWELGLARTDDGELAHHTWLAPSGADRDALSRNLEATVNRAGDRTTYTLLLPGAAMGFDADQLQRGIRFSFVVNDLDDPAEAKREGYARLTEGIAETKDPGRLRLILFE